MNTAGRKIRKRRIKLGITLDILAQRLKDVSANVSMLHRIETSKWQRSPPHANVIKRISEELGLDLENLKKAFEEDRQSKAEAKTVSSGLITPSPAEDRLEYFENILTAIEKTRIAGDSMAAANILPTIIERLKDLRTETSTHTEKTRVDRLLAMSLLEVIYAHTHTAQENKVKYKTRNYIALLHEVNYALKDRSEDQVLYEMSKIIHPVILFVAHQLKESSSLLRDKFKEISTGHPKMHCIRVPIVASSFLVEQGNLKKGDAIEQYYLDKETALRAIDMGIMNESDCAQLYEGLSLAGGFFRDPETPNFQKKAEREYDKSVALGSARYGVKVGIARTGLFNLFREPDVSPDTISKKALDAIQVFVRGGYSRHRKQIINKLCARPEKQLKELGEYIRHTPWVT